MPDLTLRALQGLSLAEKLEVAGRFAGADGRVMDGIWRTESTRGQNMRSDAGAKGHFGLMDPTRETWQQRLGMTIDPDNFDQALVASAYTLRENLQRFGNLPDALRAYNNGWNRSRWNNPETAAYAGKVLGGDADANTSRTGSPATPPTRRRQEAALDTSTLDAGAVLGGQVQPTGPVFPGARPTRQLDAEAVLAGTPGDYGNYRPTPRTTTRQSSAQRFLSQFGGFKPFGDPNAVSNVGMLETNALQTGQVAEQAREENTSGMDRFSAAVRLNTITGQLVDAIDQNIPSRDPDFDYAKHMTELEDGRNARQRTELRERATSLAHAQQIIAHQDEQAELQQTAGDSFWMNLAAGVIDPVGAVLGLGIGKGLQVANVGSRTLFGQGARAAGTASIVGEGVVGNLAGTGIIDRLANSYQAPEDYAVNGLFGALLGTAAIPMVSRGALRETRLEGLADNLRNAHAEHESAILGAAVERAGPDASPEMVAAQAETIRAESVANIINDVYGPVPAENRLFSPEDADTIDPEARAARGTELGLDGISDPTLRGLAENLVGNADRIVEANPIGENVGSVDGRPGIVARLGLSSTGETLLRSQDNVAKAMGLMLTEGTTGRGGRRHSAAITAALNERAFMRPILEYEDAFHIYRQANGQGWLAYAFGDGKLRQQFDIEVAAELRARARPDLYASTAPEPVRRAADYMADGYRLMGEEQVRAGTLGSQNIKPGDPSYFPQHISSAKVQRLTPTQDRAFIKIISEQARTIFGWDKEFSDYFGTRYLETAKDRASGNYDVPVNLTHQSAGGFVDDLLESMRTGTNKANDAKLQKASEKFQRGGAGFTKGRLNFDVMDTTKLDDGTEVRLLDIMDTDMVGMYRSYARRAAGEIALQQYGIAGKHGLTAIRKYLTMAHNAGRVTNDELAAFDQISAEFLNTPFGKHQGTAMDNLRIITSVIKLGGMGITQFGEYGNGVAALGVGRVMTAIKDIPRLMKEIGTIRKGGTVDGLLSSIEKQQGFEAGMDSFIMTRALDVKDNDVQMYGREGLGLGTRVVRGASHAQAILSGHRMVTAVQVRGLSEQVIRKAMRFIKNGEESTALADMGFSKELRWALKENMDKIAKFNGDEVESLDIFAGDLTPAQRQELVGVINRASSQIIQGTYIGETGKWAHDGFLKLLFQFRTFSLTAVEKQWGRNLRNYGALKSMMYLMGSMSFAAPIVMARAHARTIGMSEEDREAYLEKYLSIPAIAQATMTYASAAGFAGDIWDIGGSAATNIMGDAAPEWLSSTVNPRGGARAQGKLLGGAIAPSASIAEDAFRLANGDWKKLKSLLPGANLPYMVPFINAMEAQEEDK